METGEPSYDLPGHGVGAFHRRPMDTMFPYYAHHTSAPYSLPYQAPTTAPYHFGSLSHHYGSFNPYVVNQQPLTSSVRLAEPVNSLPDIRPAKNAISQVKNDMRGPVPDLPKKEEGTDIEFSTEVDVLMKAIQAKPESSSQQSLPSLQHLAPHGYAYPMTPPRMIANESQLSRSGKQRRYSCTLPGCGKAFAQKTHLDIHTRAHTGDKPFVSCRSTLQIKRKPG